MTEIILMMEMKVTTMKVKNDQEVTIATKHLVFQKEAKKCFTFARSKVTAMPLSGSIENINR